MDYEGEDQEAGCGYLMLWLVKLLFGKAKLYLAVATAVILVIGAAFLKGWTARGHQEKMRDQEDYIDARKRMDAVDHIDSPADAREWLRKRGEQ